MRIEYHALDGASLGMTRYVTALHFGPEDSGRKIYIQTSLHADELPGALVAYHLRPMLEQLEQEGRLKAHVVLVPLCNPIGLAQTLMYDPSGRFDLFTGRNFNRLTDFDLYGKTLVRLNEQPEPLGKDAVANVRHIRAVMREVIAAYQPQTQVDTLQHILVGLAFDADVVLDLHCDEYAVMHCYTLPQLWPTVEPLARLLRSECQIVSEDSGSKAFDEFLSTPWLRLARVFPQANIPCACCSATVELRGQMDLQHELAQDDAQAMVQYLAHLGDVSLETNTLPALPELIRKPHPLAGVQYVTAPSAGVVVFVTQAGETVQQGQILAQIIDPIHQISTDVRSPIDGFVFACHHVRYAQQGATLVSVSGEKDLGLGETLGP
jgi:hypothetical protein